MQEENGMNSERANEPALTGHDSPVTEVKGTSDPIASILFVLAIEILLITIRTNPKIEPYKFELLSAQDKLISNKVVPTQTT